MDILLVAIVDNQTEKSAIISFPDPVEGIHTFGCIEQLLRKRQKSCIDKFTKEVLAMVGDIEIGKDYHAEWVKEQMD